MRLFLFLIIEKKKFGVQLICHTEAGQVHVMNIPYTPYFLCVNMPVEYQRDIKKSTVEMSLQTKPYIGYTEKTYRAIIKDMNITATKMKKKLAKIYEDIPNEYEN